jgi:ABC-type transport system substrate-binding protein
MPHRCRCTPHPGSPWRDRRVRLAANHAVDRQAINQTLTLGFFKITGSSISTSFDFYWQPTLYLTIRPGPTAPGGGRVPEGLRGRGLLV